MSLDVVLNKFQLDEYDLVTLLEEREQANINFFLIDIREDYKHELSSLSGTDYNIPYSNVDDLLNIFEKTDLIVLYTDDTSMLENLGIHLIHAGIEKTFVLKTPFEQISRIEKNLY